MLAIIKYVVCCSYIIVFGVVIKNALYLTHLRKTNVNYYFSTTYLLYKPSLLCFIINFINNFIFANKQM